MKKQWVYTLLLLANLFWAGNYVFGQAVVAELSPVQMTFMRWVLAVLLLFPLAQLIEKPDWRRVFSQWKILIMLALIGIIGYNTLLYESLRFTSPVNAALVNSVSPVLIMLLSTFLLKEQLNRYKIGGLILSLAGVLLVLTSGQLEQLLSFEFNRGDLFMLIAVVLWSIYSIAGRKMVSIPPIATTSATVLVALIILTPFVLYEGLTLPATPLATTGILYMAIFPSVCAFVFWNVSLRHIDASQVGIFLYSMPVFTALMSLLLGGTLTIHQIAGGVLVFLGVMLTSRQSKKQPDTIEKRAAG